MRLLTIISFLFFSIVLYGNTSIDSLKKLIEHQNSEDSLSKYHTLIGDAYWNEGNLDSAILHFKTSVHYDSILNSKEIAGGYNNLGLVLTEQGRLIEALNYLDKSLKHYLSDSLDHTDELAIVRLNKANTLNRIGLYDESVETIIQSIEGFSATKNSKGEAFALNTLGNTFQETGQFKKAEGYFNKSLDLTQSTSDSLGIAIALNNLGLLELKRKNYPDALNYFNQSLLIKESLELKQRQASTLANIGEVYLRLKETGKAKTKLEHSLTIRRAYNDLNGIVASLLLLAEASEYNSDSKAYINEALRLSDSIGSLDVKIDVAKQQAKYFEHQGAFEKAYFIQQQCQSFEDSISSERIQTKLLVLESKYDKAQDQKRIAKLNEEKAVTELNLLKEQKKADQRFFLIVAIVIIALTLLFTLYFYQKSKTTKKLLSIKSDAEMHERKRISKELHDGIASQLTLTKRKTEVLQEKEGLGDKLDPLINDLGRISKDVSHISNKLYGRDLFLGHYSMNLKLIIQEWASYCEVELSYENKAEKTLNGLSEYKQSELYRIIQEVLENIRKHANSTKTDISFSLQKNKLIVSVKDNGLGFKTEKQHSGKGLRNIKERIKSIEGKVIIQSELGNGTSYEIKIPL